MGDAYGSIARPSTDRFGGKEVVGLGVEVGVVIGAATSFAAWRRRRPAWTARRRITWEWLATVMNALALAGRDAQQGLKSRVQSAINIEQVAEPYIRGKAMRYLEEGGGKSRRRHRQPVLHDRYGGSAARMEMNVDIVVKATKVDGVYTTIPRPSGRDALSARHFDEAIVKKLK